MTSVDSVVTLPLTSLVASVASVTSVTLATLVTLVETVEVAEILTNVDFASQDQMTLLEAKLALKIAKKENLFVRDPAKLSVKINKENNLLNLRTIFIILQI